MAYTSQDWRNNDDVRTAGLTYTPRLGAAQLSFSALYVDADRESLTLGVALSLALNDDINVGSGVTSRDGDVTATLSAQRAALNDQGFGWRASVSGGGLQRADGDLTHVGATHEIRVDFSHTASGDGLRGTFSTGIAWIGGDVMATRPVRNAFALVRVGEPNVRVLRDRRLAGVTNANGDLLLTGLRANEPNRIGVELDDFPFGAEAVADELQIMPGTRGGAIAQFDVSKGAAGEIRVVDDHGAPLPQGALLTRTGDGARFPIGVGGRTYVSGVTQAQTLASGNCLIDVAARDVANGRTLQCRALH